MPHGPWTSPPTDPTRAGPGRRPPGPGGAGVAEVAEVVASGRIDDPGPRVPRPGAARRRAALGPGAALAWLAARGPGQCEVCRTWARGRLCSVCVDRHAGPALRCARCALPIPQPGLCGRCLHAPPPWTGAVAAVDYGFPWDGLVGGLKYRRQPELARPLAGLLAQAVRGARAAATDLVVPVPLAPARLAERGYNQAWELARHAASALRLPARADAVERLFGGAHQATLSRAERLVALRGAFTVPAAARIAVAGRRIALVDDVMTTGATLAEACAALQRAGAAEVAVWVLARTPEHRG